MEWEDYQLIFSKEEINELQAHQEYLDDKSFLMTYDTTVSKELKTKLDLMLSITTDINNMSFNKGIQQLDSIDKAGTFFQNRIGLRPKEYFEIAFLDKSFHLLGVKAAFQGGITSSLVDVRELIKESQKYEMAKYIMTAHNHPSGRVQESQEDIRTDQRIKEAFQYLGMIRLDNLIVSHSGYHSTVKDRTPVISEQNRPKQEKQNGFINAKAANLLVQRGNMEALKLEEKIGVLIGQNPSNLKHIFFKKEIDHFKTTLDVNQIEALKQINQFAASIKGLLKTRDYRKTITSPSDIVHQFENSLSRMSDTQHILLFVTPGMERIKAEVITWDSKQTDMATETLKNIIKAGIYNNSKYCFMLKKADESVYDEYQKIKGQMEKVREKLAVTGIEMVDYIVMNKDSFYSDRSAMIERYCHKEQSYEYLIYKKGKQGIGLYDSKENFVGKRSGSKKEMQLIYGCPIKDPYGRLERSR